MKRSFRKLFIAASVMCLLLSLFLSAGAVKAENAAAEEDKEEAAEERTGGSREAADEAGGAEGGEELQEDTEEGTEEEASESEVTCVWEKSDAFTDEGYVLASGPLKGSCTLPGMEDKRVRYQVLISGDVLRFTFYKEDGTRFGFSNVMSDGEDVYATVLFRTESGVYGMTKALQEFGSEELVLKGYETIGGLSVNDFLLQTMEAGESFDLWLSVPEWKRQLSDPYAVVHFTVTMDDPEFPELLMEAREDEWGLAPEEDEEEAGVEPEEEEPREETDAPEDTEGEEAENEDTDSEEPEDEETDTEEKPEEEPEKSDSGENREDTETESGTIDVIPKASPWDYRHYGNSETGFREDFAMMRETEGIMVYEDLSAKRVNVAAYIYQGTFRFDIWLYDGAEWIRMNNSGAAFYTGGALRTEGGEEMEVIFTMPAGGTGFNFVSSLEKDDDRLPEVIALDEMLDSGCVHLSLSLYVLDETEKPNLVTIYFSLPEHISHFTTLYERAEALGWKEKVNGLH